MRAARDGGASGARTTRAPNARAGFTLLEVVIALTILAVGALGLAATTLNVVRRAMIADLRTERVTARRSVIETIGASPFDEIGSGVDTVGDFVVEWSVREERSDLKELAIVTVGPAPAAGAATGAGAIRPDVADTITYRVAKP